jgi:hypothetical protein
MNPDQHFFQSFFGPQIQQISQVIPEYIFHNTYILEIISNWEYIKTLVEKIKAGNTPQMDQLDIEWYNFLEQRHINIIEYKNKEEFHNVYWIKISE